MVDATAQIPAPVLAAALRDIEGVSPDPSTPDGRLECAKIVERLMADEHTAERLLEALDKHDVTGMGRQSLPASYGPAAVATRSLPSDPANDEPPIGSADFETFIQAHAEARELGQRDPATANIESLAAPSVLGFQEERVEPSSLPTRREFDAVFLEAQRELRRNAIARKSSFWHRVRAVFSDEPLEWRIKSRVLANNYFVIEAVRGSSKVHWASIASGDVLFVYVMTDGKVTLKDKLTLSDRVRTQQRLTAAFAGEAEAGAETLLELRNTLVDVAGSSTPAWRAATAG